MNEATRKDEVIEFYIKDPILKLLFQKMALDSAGVQIT